MISKISIKNTATYLDEVEFTPTKINYFYGSNGSGKTSITKVIGDIISHDDCCLEWESSELKTLVYNKDFVKSNFDQNAPIKGIFTLGEGSKETKKLIEDTRAKIDLLKESIKGQTQLKESKLKELEAVNLKFQEKFWILKQKYEEYFKPAFTGFMGSKVSFFNKCIEEQNNSSNLLTWDEIKTKCKVIFDNSLKQYENIPNLEIDNLISLEQNIILQTRIIGKEDVEIGRLIAKLNNSDWIKEGTEYLKQTNDQCPFCQQRMSASLQTEIEEFFDKSYELKCQELKNFGNNYYTYIFQRIQLLKKLIENNLEILDFKNLIIKVELLEEKLKANIVLIGNKIKLPSSLVVLDSLQTLFEESQDIINWYNTQINNNNKIVLNITSEKQKLKSEVWRFIINELALELKEFQNISESLNKAITGISTAINSKKESVTNRKRFLKEKEAEITSVIHTVNEINKILKLFGFHNFSIAEASEKGFYKIIREDGSEVKETLSEGEYTFITFLYFIKLLNGSNEEAGISQDKVVVIDDPISSLDSNVIFVVSHLIKDIINDCKENRNGIKQVFILTHNIYFHKEVTFRGNKENKWAEETYWVVRKLNGKSKIIRHENNPIRTTYELLWRELDDITQMNKVTIFNTLRRILEYYFNITGGLNYEKCLHSFEGEEKLICRSLVSWINDGSHFVNDDLELNVEPESIEKYINTFKMIFEKMGHKSHYNMMMKIQAEEAVLV